MKTKYLFLFVGMLALNTSCDVTDISPIDSFTDESYWRSVSDLEKYAEGFYKNLSEPSFSLDEVSDDRIKETYDQWLFDEWTLPSDKKDTGWEWENIRKLNFFMTRYTRVAGSETDINKQVAIIRYFRAQDYFGKIKKFGDVPWYDKDLTTNDTEELYKPRDSRDFVLGKIIEDLEFAIAWLPEKNEAKVGALHKDCARTYLSRVCLYYGTYKKYNSVSTSPTSTELLQKAVSVAQEIMNTGRYAIVKGSDAGCGQSAFDGYPLSYSNQFTQEDLTTNAECILARIYVADILTHQIGRNNGVGFSKDFAEVFLCKDGKPISMSSEYKGDETLDKEMENRDPRMYQLIDNIHRPYNIQSDGTRQVNNSIYNPNASASGLASGGSGYPCVKYHSAIPSQAEADKSTYDWFVFRYAEVLLNYAEAKYELGECTQDVLDKTINLLRDRVEMPRLTVNPVVDVNAVNYGYAVAPLLYEIRRERRVELAVEGFRYDDIIRWNAVRLFENPKTILGLRITPQVIALYQEGTFGGTTGRVTADYQGKQYLLSYPSKGLDEAGRKWAANDKRYLYPLPTRELLLNTNLVQNPGWGTK